MYSYSGSYMEYDTYLGHKESTVPYSINSCGYIRIDSKDVSLNRTRRDFYVIYLINGAGHYIMNNDTLTAKAGSIIAYWPDHHQNYYYLALDNPEFYWIHFTGSQAESLMNSLGFSGSGFYNIGIHSELIALFEKIIHELQIQKMFFHSLCAGYLVQLLSSFSREVASLSSRNKTPADSGMENVITTMNKEFQRDHLIEYYARICSLSLYQFIRNFKKVTNYSPAKYIEKIRIAKAKELLRDSDLSITEISGIVGYKDPFYFSKVFKKESGIPPSEFKSQN